MQNIKYIIIAIVFVYVCLVASWLFAGQEPQDNFLFVKTAVNKLK